MANKNNKSTKKVIPLSNKAHKKRIARILAAVLGITTVAGAATFCLTNDKVKTYLGIGVEHIETKTEDNKEIQDLKSKVNVLEDSIKVLQNEKAKALNELENYKSTLKSLQDLTTEQKQRLAELQQQVSNKQTIIDSLNSQIAEYKAQIELLESKLKNPIEENLKYIKVNQSIGALIDVYSYKNKILVVGTSKILTADKDTNEHKIINNVQISTNVYIKKIDEKNFLICYQLSGNSLLRILKINIENDENEFLKLYDGESEISSNYLYSCVTTSSNRAYISTSKGIFEVKSDRLDLITKDIKGDITLNAIDDEIYTTSTYGYKIDSQNQLTKLSEQGISGYSKYYKDIFGNLFVGSSNSFKYYNEELKSFTDLSSTGSPSLENGKIFVGFSTYFDNVSKTLVSNDNGVSKKFIETSNYLYFYGQINGLTKMDKVNGEISNIECDNIFTNCVVIDSQIYFIGSNNVFKFENDNLYKTNLQEGITLKGNSFQSAVKVNSNEALLFNTQGITADGYIAILNLETNTITKVINAGSCHKYYLNEDFFISYNFSDGLSVLNLQTYDLKQYRFSFDYANNRYPDIYLKDNKILLAEKTYGYSFLIDLEKETVTNKYLVGSSKFNDYFFFSVSSGVDGAYVLYDFESDKLMALPKCNLVNTEDGDFLITTMGDIYYI